MKKYNKNTKNMRRNIFLIILIMVATINVVKAQEEVNIKPWTDVIIDNREPKDWKWNKTSATRFSIRGDFDGDGFEENLYETDTAIVSDNKELTPLHLDGDLGVYFLINEGDLDGDGGDEISLMTVYRDYSNVNFFRVFSYTGNSWTELFNVKAHEYDCPNYRPTKPEEMFTYTWKRKNHYDMNKVILKKEDGVVDVIGTHPCGRYAVEHIKIVNKRSAKREWGEIIEPRTDL
jgi:hypothetical protein